MSTNAEIRRLAKKWSSGTGWPKRLDWIEVKGLRGWSGQRVDFAFPIVAIVGENGSGKSTLLQAAACVYRAEDPDDTHYASEFFPDTAWDEIQNATVKFGYKEGGDRKEGSIRKPTSRWLGNVERPIRAVEYIDLSRIQPVSARVGYAKIAKTKHVEASAKAFDEQQVRRLSEVMGRSYDAAKMALSDIDDKREVPVVSKQNTPYSGFHQGSGETTVAELLQVDLPRYGLVIIDEIESSLHPRAQRRLVRDLAGKCRERECQIILSTHSPYVLEELPLEARMYILETQNTRKVVPGVSPQFAMTKMDDEVYPECDLYVEDNAAKVMLGELLAYHAREIFTRCQIIPFGAATVGHALGQMVANRRFPRPSCVFLDGDNSEAVGCRLLPGEDAPEQVVFNSLKERRWGDLWTRIGRDISLVSDACANAMTLGDHHEWIRFAANQLMCGGETLWQAMCAEWAKTLRTDDVAKVVQPIEDTFVQRW
jgi:predicted ATPase